VPRPAVAPSAKSPSEEHDEPDEPPRPRPALRLVK
jgi:hypothetical protein